MSEMSDNQPELRVAFGPGFGDAEDAIDALFPNGVHTTGVLANCPCCFGEDGLTICPHRHLVGYVASKEEAAAALEKMRIVPGLEYLKGWYAEGAAPDKAEPVVVVNEAAMQRAVQEGEEKLRAIRAGK